MVVHPTITDPTTYVHGFGLVNQQIGINPTEWFTFDAIGSTQDITLTTDDIGQQNVYEPFGTASLEIGSTESRFGALGCGVFRRML